jgi:prepilin signal peptidase PulO-like enzyme (type II secretory pathway)
MNPAEAVAVFAVMAYLVLDALLVGSFINLAADRLPRGESIVHPRSHCRSCGRVLNLVDLIPVAGFVVRRGRCASCGASIGASAPAVEAACGLLMLVPLATLGLLPGALVGGVAVMSLGVAVVSLAFARAGARPESRRD